MNHTDLFVPVDVCEANDAWGANCGPGALAAMLGIPCSDVRRYIADFRGYLNASQMADACVSVPPELAEAIVRANFRSWRKRTNVDATASA